MTTTNSISVKTLNKIWDDNVDIRVLITTALQKKVFIGIVTGLFFVTAVFYFTQLPDYYESHALLEIENQKSSLHDVSLALGHIGDGWFQGNASPAEIQKTLIMSRFVLEPIIEKIGLNIIARPQYFPLIGKFFAHGGEAIEVSEFVVPHTFLEENFHLIKVDDSHYQLFSPNGNLLLEGEIGTLVKTPPQVSPFVTIRVNRLQGSAGTRFQIKRIPEDILISSLLKKLTIKELGTRTGVLEINLQHVEAQKAVDILNAIIDYTIEKNIERQLEEVSKTLAFLQKQLPEVQNSLHKADTEFNEYRAKKGSVNMTMDAQVLLTKLSDLDKSLEQLKLKKIEHLADLTSQHPKIIMITEKQKKLVEEQQSLENKIRQLPLTDQKAVALKREIKVKTELYVLLLNRIQQLQVMQAGRISNVHVLHHATLPNNPMPLHRLIKVAVSTLLGFLLACLLACIRRLISRNVEDPEVVEEYLGISNYALIPYSKTQSQLHRLLKNSERSKTVRLLAKLYSRDPVIESLRSLRTTLHILLKETHKKTVSIIGATPEIGKTFVSLNLAQVLADSGVKVLFIATDMHKDTVHHFLPLNRKSGLSEYLSVDSNCFPHIQKVGENFDVIMSGKSPKDPSKLFLSDRFQLLLSELSNYYDLILVDTPPILAVGDALKVCQHIGINIMVVGHGKEHLKELGMAFKRCKKHSIEISGFVMNATKPTLQSYDGYQYCYTYKTNQ